MLSSKRTCLTSSIECEPILNEDSHPVPHLEDVVISDSDDSEPCPGKGLLATCSAESDLGKSCLNSSVVEIQQILMRTLMYHPLQLVLYHQP